MATLEVTRETIHEQRDGSAAYDWTFRAGQHGAAFRVHVRQREVNGKWWADVLGPSHLKDWSKLTRKPWGHSGGVRRPAFDSGEEALSDAEQEIRELLSRLPEFS
jgi:hypothetical protein